MFEGIVRTLWEVAVLLAGNYSLASSTCSAIKTSPRRQKAFITMNVILTNGPDLFVGNTTGQNIQARGGNDVIRAGAGDDTISGGAGNDAMNGGVGNDAIDGGAGNDKINGGEGSDRMKGGAGNDTFFFHKGEVSNDSAHGLFDHIIDFQGAGGYSAEQDFIRFEGFGIGSTFTYERAATDHKNGAMYEIHDTTDGSTVEILIQFADDNYTGTTHLLGAANGSHVNNADFGWL